MADQRNGGSDRGSPGTTERPPSGGPDERARAPHESAGQIAETLHGVPRAGSSLPRPVSATQDPTLVAPDDATPDATPDAAPDAADDETEKVPVLPERPVFVSMKPSPAPEAAIKTPVIPAIERPDMQPRLRSSTPIPATRSPADLGRYAPPRQANQPRPRASAAWYVLWILLAGLAGAGITLLVRSL
ncbi:hypothetical protein [Haliangium sp.]|uniref:hypothetical protein n=1 Tax=Haliangium sp. TaxID=2663208 RepID=UPI003D0AF5C2